MEEDTTLTQWSRVTLCFLSPPLMVFPWRLWRLRILRSSLLNFDQCGTSNYDSVIAVPTGDAFRCLDLLFFLMEIDTIHAWMDTAQ